MKCKQSQKIESNIKKLHEKEDFAAASDSMSSKESGATHPTTPTTADSKNINDQLLNL